VHDLIAKGKKCQWAKHTTCLGLIDPCWWRWMIAMSANVINQVGEVRFTAHLIRTNEVAGEVLVLDVETPLEAVECQIKVVRTKEPPRKGHYLPSSGSGFTRT